MPAWKHRPSGSITNWCASFWRRTPKNELAEKAEILRLFLESADFNKLRAESEKHLLAGRKVKFLVHLERGQPKYEMQVI